MAKLDGVKVLDMVGGNVTKVAYNGAEYVKTDEIVKDGDIFQLLPGNSVIGGEDYAFYATRIYLDGDIVISTEYNGNATAVQSKGFGTAFRKVSASKPTIDERVDSLEKRVDALEEKPEAPSFKEGDIVVITGNTNGSENSVGNIGKITKIDTREARVKVPDGPKLANWSLFTEIRHATQAEREQYEEALKPKKPNPKAGDWVKFTSYKGVANRDDISLNKAYQVFTDTDDELAFVDDAGDKRIQPLKAVDALETVAPQTAFERIGRKEGEFKVGDIVRVIDAEGSELSNGDIGIITEIDDDSVPFFVSVPNKDTAGNYQCLDDIELITPVESRVDVPCA